MSNRPSLDDYVDVAERIQDFKDAHPDGSLQTLSWEVTTIGDRSFIVYRAAAYRNPDDPRPGHGIAWEPFPGTTPYTKNSELMNAETAAWGRAIVALGLAANRKLASRQEVRARIEEQDSEGETVDAPPTHMMAGAKRGPEPKPSSRQKTSTRPDARTGNADGHSGAENGSQTPPGDTDTEKDDSGPVTDETLAELSKTFKDVGANAATFKALAKEVGAAGKKANELTEDQATWVIIKLREGK